MSGKGGGGQQQTPSKWPMSPLKRFHRVAPSPEPSTASRLPERVAADRSLQSSSASLLDKGGRGRGQEETRPGSAPTEREAMPYEQPAVAVVAVKSKAGGEPCKLVLTRALVKAGSRADHPPFQSKFRIQ